MNEHNEHRHPQAIESDIERTRADFSSTIDAIQSKLTPGQLMDQAFAYARTSLPADFGSNLSNAIRDNPVPVTLIGIGIAWLAASGRRSDGRARARRLAMEEDRDFYARSAGMDYETTYGAELSPNTSSEGTGEGTMQRTASKARETGREMKDKASEIGHEISSKTSELAGRAKEMTHSARDRMSESAESARARMSEAGHRSQAQYYRAKDRVGHMLDEQPLLVGALGMAIGTLLGAALPSTRREDEMMGRTRDDLLERARETARDQVDTVKESAQRVAQVAKQEVEKLADKASSEARAPGQGNGQASRTAATPGAERPAGPQGRGLH